VLRGGVLGKLLRGLDSALVDLESLSQYVGLGGGDVICADATAGILVPRGRSTTRLFLLLVREGRVVNLALLALSLGVDGFRTPYCLWRDSFALHHVASKESTKKEINGKE
jgi:hypothetical protein